MRFNLDDVDKLPNHLRDQIYEQLGKKTDASDSSNGASNMEPDTGHAPLGTEKVTRFTSPCRIHVHSIRKRLADPDGVSIKAAIDGLVHAGVLEDDSAKYVKGVSYSQEKAVRGEEEQTIITIEEV